MCRPTYKLFINSDILNTSSNWLIISINTHTGTHSKNILCNKLFINKPCVTLTLFTALLNFLVFKFFYLFRSTCTPWGKKSWPRALNFVMGAKPEKEPCYVYFGTLQCYIYLFVYYKNTMLLRRNFCCFWVH